MTSIPVRNPRSGANDYQLAVWSPERIAERARQLKRAQQRWTALTVEERAEQLLDWQQQLLKQRDALIDTLSIDTGRYLLAASEVQGAIDRISYWAARAPALLAANSAGHSEVMPSVRYQHQRVPYPLVGIISPWNFPLTLAMIDAIPALMAGCAVLLKPSEVTPRFAAVLQNTLAELPILSEVMQVISGGADTGRALVDQVDAICFTGSVETGRLVGKLAMERLIPAFLELGGKDPAIVLASTDIANACRAILRSAAGATGQACMSLERIYVQRPIYATFLDQLVQEASRIKLNFPDIHSGHLGPFIFARQADRVAAQLTDARAKGAHIHCGGEVENLGGGLFCKPTVLSQVSDDMLLMQEETFGPLLPVIPFDTIDEAVHLANDSEFGLSASVFAGTEQEALTVAEQINAGAVGINDASLTVFVNDVEKHSFGHSGLGSSRMGESGLLRFFRTKALLVQTAPAMPLDAFNESQARPSE